MSFGQFLSILRARKWAALGILFVVVLGTLAVSLILPKQYLGTASVVVDVRPDPVSVMGSGGIASQAFIATQVDILNSDRVAMRVIRDLKLADNPSIRELWQKDTDGQGTIEQYVVEFLQKALTVKPSRDSNVISLEFKSPDPRFAAALANAFAQAYIATTLELRVDPAKQFNTFFQVQTKESRENLARAQSRLSEFQQSKGIIASDERFDIENARLAELNSQLTQIQAVAAESTSRQAQAQGNQSDRLQEVLNNPLISGLRADLTRSEAKLQELTQRLGDQHPQVVETRASIHELRTRIDAEIKRVSGGVGVSNTINRAREQQLRSALEVQRSKALQLKAIRDEGIVLQREVENAQRAYDNLIARLNQTALEAQNTQSYANLLTSAQPPVDPDSPKVVLNVVLALFLGLLLAIGAVLMLELSDRRLRVEEDVLGVVGLPVVGVLPRPGEKRQGVRARMLVTHAAALSLPAPIDSQNR